MKSLLLFLGLIAICLTNQTFGQNDYGDAEQLRIDLAKKIKPAEIEKHLTILASDAFEGRETGTPGNEKAAEYIAGQFRKFGLKPVGDNDTYFQRIEFSNAKWETSVIKIDGAEYKLLWDFVVMPEKFNVDMSGEQTDEVHFLGYGIDAEAYSDYGKDDYRGASILIYQGEPVSEDGISQITGTTEMSQWDGNMELKLIAARRRGVKMVYIIADDIQTMIRQSRRRLLGRNLQLNKPGERGPALANHVYISRKMAEAIMGNKQAKVIKAREKGQQKGKPKAVKLKTDIVVDLTRDINRFESSNVVGLLEGLNTDLRDEYVVVTGHYDHLGKRGDDVYNGADDNGSGTSTILELVQSFAEAKTLNLAPQRNILFLLVTGEEKGLLGSKYYTDNPIFPLEQTVVNVNVDMIGRVDEAHASDPNYIYVIGSDKLSTELHEINESANDTYTQIMLDYTYNDENDPNRYYYRSDHYNFAKNGIPAIFYFSGVHDDYHRPSDTVEKIMFDKVAKIGQLIFHTTWDLANRPDRIAVDVEPQQP